MTRRVLVVDDEPGFREMLEWDLRDQDVHVDTAPDGRQAQAMLSCSEYSLVITDISMPRMDGLNLLTLIKKEKPTLPVIVMTGFGTVEAAVGAMKAGASDFILKPFDLESLSARARELMGLPLAEPRKSEDETGTGRKARHV